MRGVDCYSCKRRHRACHLMEGYLSTCMLKRFPYGLPLPHCSAYVEDSYRGIDGVLTAKNPPRPLFAQHTNNKTSTNRIGNHDARP